MLGRGARVLSALPGRKLCSVASFNHVSAAAIHRACKSGSVDCFAIARQAAWSRRYSSSRIAPSPFWPWLAMPCECDMTTSLSSTECNQRAVTADAGARYSVGYMVNPRAVAAASRWGRRQKITVAASDRDGCHSSQSASVPVAPWLGRAVGKGPRTAGPFNAAPPREQTLPTDIFLAALF